MNVLRFLFEAPASDWIRFTGFLCGIVFFIILAEKTRANLGWSPEINRKLVHVLTGILVFFCPFFFISGKPLVWMAVLFAGIDFVGVETGKLKGMHGTARKSFGTVFYPFTFFILVLTCWNGRKTVLILSMLILALADAAAAVMGENLKRPHEFRLWKDKKSFEGSSVMFLTSFLIVWLLLPRVCWLDSIVISGAEAAWIGSVAAVIATLLEAMSSKGSDNLTSPLGAAFVLNFMLYSPTGDALRLTAGLLLGAAIAFSSLRLRFLAPSGSAAAFVLAAILFGIGGWSWTVPILVFFVSSSLLSKTGKGRKKQFAGIFEKTDTRDMGQVAANGGTAGFLAVLFHFFPNPLWYTLHLGAVAAVNADTWATEIGVFSRNRPRSIIGLKPVSHGTSGGVTLLGTVGALLGSALIAATGRMAVPADAALLMTGPILGAITLAGLVASLCDSVLGATVQAQYRCPVCGKITEKQAHCVGRETQHASGLRFMSNDWVNWVCSVTGAVAAWVGIQIVLF